MKTRTSLQIHKARRKVAKLREIRDARRAEVFQAEDGARAAGLNAWKQAGSPVGKKCKFIQAAKAGACTEAKATYWAAEAAVEKAAEGTAAFLTESERRHFPSKGMRVGYYVAALT